MEKDHMAYYTTFHCIYGSITLPSLLRDFRKDFWEEVTFDQIMKAEEDLGTRLR